LAKGAITASVPCIKVKYPRCPHCDSGRHMTYGKVGSKEKGYYRYHVCNSCGARFRSYEEAEKLEE
jgi:transcriptional regulator NrdR family protein